VSPPAGFFKPGPGGVEDLGEWYSEYGCCKPARGFYADQLVQSVRCRHCQGVTIGLTASRRHALRSDRACSPAALPMGLQHFKQAIVAEKIERAKLPGSSLRFHQDRYVRRLGVGCRFENYTSSAR